MKFVGLWLSAVSLSAVMVLCWSQVAEAVADNERPVAVLGSIKITEKVFKAEIEKGEFGLPGRFEKAEQREALLEDMVRSELLYVTAIKDGYDTRPEILNAYKRIIIHHYRQENLEPALTKITVTEDEIRTFYHEHISDFSTPQMVRAAVIEISIPAKTTDKRRTELLKRAEDARAEALSLDPNTLSFGPVAIKYSDDQVSRYRGGDTGLMKRRDATDRWGNEISDAIFSLAVPGQISPVIVSPIGCYIAKLMERKEGATRPLAEVQEMIQGRIFSDKRVQKEKEFYGKLSAGRKVEINRELLDKIQPPNAGAKSAPPAIPRQ